MVFSHWPQLFNPELCGLGHRVISPGSVSPSISQESESVSHSVESDSL